MPNLPGGRCAGCTAQRPGQLEGLRTPALGVLPDSFCESKGYPDLLVAERSYAGRSKTTFAERHAMPCAASRACPVKRGGRATLEAGHPLFFAGTTRQWRAGDGRGRQPCNAMPCAPTPDPVGCRLQHGAAAVTRRPQREWMAGSPEARWQPLAAPP